VLDLLLLVLTLRPTIVLHYHRFRRRRQPRPTSLVPLDSLARDDTTHTHHEKYQEAVDVPAELTALERPTKEMQLFVESLNKCLGTRQVGLSLRFESLELELPSGKKILRGVTGSMASGSMWGIMGASGAGKCEIPQNL
jgi:ABC-type multidrug transport system fused ATPase/permease subunit